MFRIFLFTLCLLTAHTQSVMAEPPPLPQRKTADLQVLRQQMEAENLNREQIGKNLKEAEKDLKNTKAGLVKAGEAVRAQETLLQSLQQRIDENQKQSAGLEASLRRDYGSLSELILTLARLRQTPPEAMLVRPHAPLDAARAASLLKHMMESVNRRTAELSKTLFDLARTRDELDRDRRHAEEGKAALEAKYAEVALLLNKRETLYKNLNRDYKNSESAVQKLAQEARNLQDFMARLEENRAEDQHSGETREVRKQARRPAATEKNAGRIPAVGTITISYGEKDKIGARNNGITIQTQPRAIAVCPLQGVVKFSGSFKDYGNIVIIEHESEYHSLIMGLDKISVVIGQQLDAGEPVGHLPTASSRGGPPALYYELRHKGKPVDPSGKFAELRS